MNVRRDLTPNFVNMMRFRIILLFTILKLYLANGETLHHGGLGFGFEIMLAKLEAIEERLIALEASVQTAESAIKVWVKPDKSPKYPLGIEPTAEQLQAGEDSIYSSCLEVPARVSGKYLIRIPGDAQPSNLLCDIPSAGAGWIVVQNRFNGSESFYRNWADYESGFGNLDGEFWLGLQRISALVNNGRQWEIMFWLKNFEGQMLYTKYYKFALGNATDGYELKQVTEYSGNAGDSFSQHVGMKFSTYDRDNDPVPYNCAKKHRGGWWYHQYQLSSCFTSNLNGRYGNNVTEQSNSWPTMSPAWNGVRASKIMIREFIYQPDDD